MLQEARDKQISRGRTVALYAGAGLASLGFLADQFAGMAPSGLLIVGLGLLFTIGASLHKGRTMASRMAASVIGAVAGIGLLIGVSLALALALSDTTIVLLGANSAVQVTDGIGSISVIEALGIGILVFAAGFLASRLVGPGRRGLSRLFDIIDGLARRGQAAPLAVGFSTLSSVAADEEGQA